VLSNLYLASAALKRYHDLDSPEHMAPLFTWAMEESLGQSERALDELLTNFPNKVLGCLLRVIVFPLGRRHKGPSDKLGAEVAAVIGRAKGDP
ncbi:acyl-CoA dehydrogenase domain-containing protein, partial [Paraburkholderia sp. SIMBA_049]